MLMNSIPHDGYFGEERDPLQPTGTPRCHECGGKLWFYDGECYCADCTTYTLALEIHGNLAEQEEDYQRERFPSDDLMNPPF
jgi:hypothetical protein